MSHRASFTYRKHLFRLSNKLNDSDIVNLKFLCGDVVAKRVLERVTSGYELFLALEGVNRLSATNLDFLELVMENISKAHLVQELREVLADPANYAAFSETEGGDSTGPPSLPPTHPASLKFKAFLVSLGDELPERDLKTVAYFFRSYDVTGLTAQDIQRLSEPAELFKILKQEKVISVTDLGKMREVMDAIGRLDLCEKIDEYLESVSGDLDGGRGGGHQIVLDSREDDSESMSGRYSFGSSDGHVVWRQRPGGANQGAGQPHPPIQTQPSLGGPKTGIPDTSKSPVCEEGGGGKVGCHMMVGGNVAAPVPAVAMEQTQTGQKEYVAQSVGGAVGKLVGHESAFPVNHTLGTLQSRPDRRNQTRTQCLQQELSEKMDRVKLLEAQLEHERLHTRQSEREQRELVEQLRMKNSEVNGLREQVNGLDQQLQSGDETEMYPTNSVAPHGKAIVIVNDEFFPNPSEPSLRLDKRCGAGSDLFLFKQTLEFLGYIVEAHPNLKSHEMYQVISEAAGRDHAPYDSFVCCVSTHGDDEVMYGVDSVGVKRCEVLQIVKQSESLRGKPKMFFIQACRTRSSEATTRHSWTNYQPNAPEQDADVFVANATTANYASYRDRSQGSWFVTALHHVLTARGLQLTLTALMHEVNREVCTSQGMFLEENEGREEFQEARQCAEITSSFRYSLRFKFPSQ